MVPVSDIAPLGDEAELPAESADSPRTYKSEHGEAEIKSHSDMLVVDLYCCCEIHQYLLTAVKHEYLRCRGGAKSNLPTGFSVLRSCLAFLFD